MLSLGSGAHRVSHFHKKVAKELYGIYQNAKSASAVLCGSKLQGLKVYKNSVHAVILT
jgi:hypothetical protein